MGRRKILLARALALSWAGFWLLFFVAESWVWSAPLSVLACWAGVGLLFLIFALLPWRWEMTGGLALTVLGLLLAVAYPIWARAQLPTASRVISTVTLSGPPLVAGIVFLMHHLRTAAART